MTKSQFRVHGLLLIPCGVLTAIFGIGSWGNWLSTLFWLGVAVFCFLMSRYFLRRSRQP